MHSLNMNSHAIPFSAKSLQIWHNKFADDSIVKKHLQLESGPMPNVTVALPYIGGALCSTPQSLADAHY